MKEDLPVSKTLVAIPAHADDVELNAGGTVAKWAADGGKVHVIMMTDNCVGIRIAPEQCTAIRHAEQQASAECYGGIVHYRMYSQRFYWDEQRCRLVTIGYANAPPPPECFRDRLPLLIAAREPDQVESLADQIIALRPDLVLTHTPLDLDPEHHAVTAMVWSVFQVRKKELADTTLRYWMPGSSCQDGMLPPSYDHFEDISDYFDRKLELFDCHKSQHSDLPWAMIKDRAAHFGRQIGVKHAEPFTTAMRNLRFG